MKPEEFWIIGGGFSGDDDVGLQVLDFDPKDPCTHVIEYSVYNQLVYELDKSRDNHVKKINQLTEQNNNLSKAYEIAEKHANQLADKYLQLVEQNKALENSNRIFDEHATVMRPHLAKLTQQNRTMREALDYIAKTTYGTEFCNSDEENNSILAPWVFRYQNKAREALAKCGSTEPTTKMEIK